MNSVYSSWDEKLFLALEGLIAGLIFLNISLCGMLFVTRDIDHACYVDDNAPDVAADSMKDIIRKWENDSIKLFKWFSDNK